MFAPEATEYGVWQAVDAAPAPTGGPVPPAWLGMRNLALRQEEDATSVFTETCAYYSFTENDRGWEALACEGGCTTSGSLFGCSNLPATCNDNTASICSGTDSAAVTCCETDFPFCVTGIMTQDDNVFTAYRCGKDFLSGETDLYQDTSRTFTETVDGDKTTVFITSDGSASGTGGAEADPDSTGEGESGGDVGGGGNDTPVGAIVGGVIGGVALILLVAFGIWFIRFQKRKTADRNASTEAYRHTEMSGGYPSPSHQAPQVYGYPSTSPGYAGSTSYAGASYTGSSPPPDGQFAQQPVMAEAPGSTQYGQGVVSELPTYK